MKTELQESSMFQDLQIFENNDINIAVDSIYQLLEENFGSVGEKLQVCGSVAKILDQNLPEKYEPKDIDFVVTDFLFWRFLYANAEKICQNVIRMNYRIVLTFDSCVAELWVPQHQHEIKNIFKNKIYYCYAN